MAEITNQQISEIEDYCMGRDIREVEEWLEREYDADWCDEKIDDGDEDDGYVMLTSYQIGHHYFRFYWDDEDGIITYIYVR